MAVKIKKRAIFLLSLLFTGILGMWNTYFRSNNPNDSLIASIAQADAPAGCGWCGCNWTESECNNYYNGGGDAGCCADASNGGSCSGS